MHAGRRGDESRRDEAHMKRADEPPVTRVRNLMTLTCVTVPLNLPSAATSLSVWEINYLLARLTIGAVMSRNVVAIESDRAPREAAQLMLDHGFGALPVVDGGLDLLRAFVHTV
jgi:CBS domain-containing protein